MSYLFGLMEKDFDDNRHVLTGLFDVNEYPIVKELENDDSPEVPCGFGYHDIWKRID